MNQEGWDGVGGGMKKLNEPGRLGWGWGGGVKKLNEPGKLGWGWGGG